MKIKMKILLIFFIMLILNCCLNFCFSDVKALDTSKITTYQAGDKFELSKNAYKYIIEHELWWIKAVKDPEYTGFLFRKGDVVKYTGTYVRDNYWYGGGTYYLEVESSDGKKKGYVHSANLEPYESQRPNSLSSFMSQNGIQNMSDKELEAKLEEFKKQGANSAGIDGAKRDANGVLTNYKTVDERKKQLNNLYKDAKDNVAVIDGDSQFKAIAYIYAQAYASLKAEEKQDSKPVDEIKEDEWDDQVKEAMEDYQNAETDAEKRAAAMRAAELLQNMPEDKREETIDGRKAEDILAEIIISEDNRESGETIYKKPSLDTNNTVDSSASISDMMNDGDDFIKSATNNPIKTEQLQSVSSNLYNIFVEIGVVLAVIIGLIIGIKYMYTSVDQKAEIKKLLVPYLIGCVVIFGALGIWKFVVTLLETI